jgi:hypothetical protein
MGEANYRGRRKRRFPARQGLAAARRFARRTTTITRAGRVINHLNPRASPPRVHRFVLDKQFGHGPCLADLRHHDRLVAQCLVREPIRDAGAGRPEERKHGHGTIGNGIAHTEIWNRERHAKILD